jgi:hypothetical protein
LVEPRSDPWQPVSPSVRFRRRSADSGAFPRRIGRNGRFGNIIASRTARGHAGRRPKKQGRRERFVLGEGHERARRKIHGRAPRVLLHRLHSTRSDPDSMPPAATGTTWSAVRSELGCGSRPQPGHTSPCCARHSATAAARRSRSAAVYGRRCRFVRCILDVQSGQREPDGIRTPQPMQGRGVTASASARAQRAASPASMRRHAAWAGHRLGTASR